MALTTSPMGIDFIKAWETCKLTAYLCPAGVWTIGWGSTRFPNGVMVRRGMKITQEQADEIFLEMLKDYERGVNDGLSDNIKKKIQRYQFDALVSFAYNNGVKAFKNSTLLKRLNDGAWAAVGEQFARWVWADGKKSNGLIRRRAAERKLWESGDYDMNGFGKGKK